MFLSRIVIFCIFSLMAINNAFAKCNPFQKYHDGMVMVYEGAITIDSHKVPIAMHLIFKRGYAEAAYSYVDSTSDIILKGKLSRNGKNIELREVRKDGARGEVFKGRFADHDPKFPSMKYARSKCEVIKGKWYDPRGRKSYEFYLSTIIYGGSDDLKHFYDSENGFDDEIIHSAVRNFKDAVRAGDKKLVASMMEYPVRVNLSESDHRMVHSPSQFIKIYDVLFDECYESVILSSFGRYLFGDATGNIALGSGKVWFNRDGRIVTLNALRPHERLANLCDRRDFKDVIK